MSTIPTRYQAIICENINQKPHLNHLIIQGPSKQAVSAALYEYTRTYHLQLTLDEYDEVNRQIKHIQAKCTEVITELTSLWNHELKDKFEHLKTLKDQEHANFSRKVSIQYNQQIHKLLSSIPSTIDLKNRPTAKVGHQFSKKIRWRNVPEIINYLKHLSTTLNKIQTRENIWQQLFLPFTAYIGNYPEKLQKYLQNNYPEITLFYCNDELDKIYFHTNEDSSINIEIIDPYDYPF